MSNIDYKELIEQYLTGTISDGNKSVLESKLASDMSLRAEMKSQSNMVSGLKSFRKAELKTRLDNVPLEVGALGTLGQSALVKIGAAIGTTVLLVGGIYYFSETTESIPSEITEIAPIISSEEALNATGTELTELPGVEVPVKPIAENHRHTPSQAVDQNTTKELAKDVAVAEEIAPRFSKPTVVEFDTDEEFEAESIAGENAPNESDPVAINRPIDIEVKANSSANKLQYQFYEERLYLYGNFGEVPYEIIEINSKGGKRIYLYHQETYYKLSYPTNKVSELMKVTNEELLKELKIFRENKALN